jgi:hypothetical protein
MTRTPQSIVAAASLCVWLAQPAAAQYIMERLGRGVIAVRTSETEVFVGWRVLGSDSPDVAFNL